MENKTLYQKKYFTCKTLDIDTTGKKVKVAIAECSEIDSDSDLIVPTAFDKTIKERGPMGSNLIWHLLDHSTNSFSALSKFSELNMQGNYLAGLSAYKDSFAWREVAWPLYEAGDFNQHSIGYSVIEDTKMDKYRELRELMLYEGSAVLWGANPNTPTLAVQKSLGISPSDDLVSQIERLSKAIKLGKHEDESHKELIIIELKRIQTSIYNLQQKFTKPPFQNGTKPDLEGKEFLKDIASMNLLFAIK